MKIGFVINQLPKELGVFTTTGLAMAALRAGHHVFYLSVGDFVYFEQGRIGAHVRPVPLHTATDGKDFLNGLRTIEKVRLDLSELDIIWLRNDPAMDMEKRVWATDAGMIFGQLAAEQGVLVLNNPVGLMEASSKFYLQYFPENVRPRTVITRKLSDVEDFFKSEGNKIILKPLKGSGGKNVFLLDSKDRKNMKQIMEAISRDGFVIAQEYLPEAKNGDTRVFLVNGEPLVIQDKIAAIQRVQQKGEVRSNVHQGGKAFKAEVTEAMHEIIRAVAPKLKADGMFFVGLDIVGNKLMEINVFSPGGLATASELNGVDYLGLLIEKAVAARENQLLNREKLPRRFPPVSESLLEKKGLSPAAMDKIEPR